MGHATPTLAPPPPPYHRPGHMSHCITCQEVHSGGDEGVWHRGHVPTRQLLAGEERAIHEGVVDTPHSRSKVLPPCAPAVDVGDEQGRGAGTRDAVPNRVCRPGLRGIHRPQPHTIMPTVVRDDARRSRAKHRVQCKRKRGCMRGRWGGGWRGRVRTPAHSFRCGTLKAVTVSPLPRSTTLLSRGATLPFSTRARHGALPGPKAPKPSCEHGVLWAPTQRPPPPRKPPNASWKILAPAPTLYTHHLYLQ
jgi:hypothetical protein